MRVQPDLSGDHGDVLDAKKQQAPKECAARRDLQSTLSDADDKRERKHVWVPCSKGLDQKPKNEAVENEPRNKAKQDK